MKKQLLQESEIRKMMKFANIAPLTDGFVERLTEAEEADEKVDEGMYNEEDLEEQADPMGDVMPVDDEDADPVGDMGDEDLDAEEDLGGEPEPGGEMELSPEQAQVIIDLGSQLEAAMAGEEDLGDMDDMDDVDMSADDEEAMPLEEADLDEDLVNEVLSRVARRLKDSE
jgi:hypothetical protein